MTSSFQFTQGTPINLFLLSSCVMVKTNEQTLNVPWFLAIIASHKRAIIASYYSMCLTFFKSTADNSAAFEVHRYICCHSLFTSALETDSLCICFRYFEGELCIG